MPCAVSPGGAVGNIDKPGDLDRNLERLVDPQSALLQTAFQRLAFEVLHDEERGAVQFANVVERADMRMIELRDRAGFAVEAVAELRISGQRLRENFDRDGAIEARVARLVDLTHAASAEGGLDFVRAEARTGGKSHRLLTRH